MVNAIISYTGYAVSAIVLVLGIILKIKDARKYNKAQALSIVFNEVANTVSEAERIFGGGNGYAKLAWAISKLQMLALKNNVEISDEDLKVKIEEVLTAPEKKKQEKVEE